MNRLIKIGIWLFRLTIVFVLSICIGLFVIYLQGPPSLPTETTFVDENGELINSETTQKLTLNNIPKEIIDATILIEDQHFYNHFGFDYRGIIRAMIKNIEAHKLKEGASTITQQLARNLYLTHEKTWLRKLKEAYFTIRLEMFYSKDTIIMHYLNNIYYGHGAYGIAAASQLFFNKKVDALSTAEIALLIGIPKGPTYYSPYNDYEQAIRRQQMILKTLVQKNVITEAAYYTAISEKIDLVQEMNKAYAFAGHFLDYAWKEVEQILEQEKTQLITQGITIHTTLNKQLQLETERSIQQSKANESELEVGVLSIDPKTGAILQMIGSKNYQESPFNRAVDAKRMVGSTFKPFLYYAALENGYTATTMLQSEPTTFIFNEQEVYKPSNYNGYYAYDKISLAQAMALSDNIYAVKTNLFLSPETVAKTAAKFGITTKLPVVPSLALGSASISLLEMTKAYSVIANRGKAVDIFAIKKITNHEGKVLYEKKQAEPEQWVDETKTFLLTVLMKGMFDRRLNGYMEVTGASIVDKLTRNYAGKSGSTTSDSWMIGFSPTIVTGVWTGFDNNRQIQHYTEKTLAKTLWADTMEFAHQLKNEDEDFKQPNDVVNVLVDVETGLLATEQCNVVRTTYFERGTEPKHYCTHHTHKHEAREDVEKVEDSPFFKRWFDEWNWP